MARRRLKIKRGDYVEVMTGQSKGQRGTVERVLLDKERLIIAGVRSVIRHIKPSQACPEGKFSRPLSVHVSNVAVVDRKTNSPGRVGYRFDSDGNKERFFKRTGSVVPGYLAKT